ncbi:MAG TPA: galactokinase [Cytophagales bacterium]|nr:galactokinase [Cytophagales bacterium]
MIEERIRTEFSKWFKSRPLLIKAPGRINLLGEHVDYQQGVVMPAAIDRHFVLAMAAAADDKCNIFAADLEEGVSFSVNDLAPGEAWINYLMGVLDGFQRKGFSVRGVDCVLGSTIPAGAGLSSSAALCSGFAFGINELFGCGLDRTQLALIAQRAEHEFAEVRCGIMDQYASLWGSPDAVLVLDCRSLTHQTLNVNWGGYALLLIDTKVKHALASTEYNQRREACAQAVEILQRQLPGIKSLRDVRAADLLQHEQELEHDTFIKALYVVEEMARVNQAVDALKLSDLPAVGQLMTETHWGLSQAYEVSCDELDFLVSLAQEKPEWFLGARMMGGGFGGCTLNLVKLGDLDPIVKYMTNEFQRAFGRAPEFYPVRLSPGVHSVFF